MTTLLLTLAAIFAFGTWGFWIACILLGGAITLLVENEKGTWAYHHNRDHSRSPTTSARFPSLISSPSIRSKRQSWLVPFLSAVS